MNKLFSLIIIFLIISLSAPATIIHLHNREYAGKELRFFRYSDPVTKNKILSFSLKIDSQGHSNKEIPVNTTTYVFCDFGIYRGMLFLEPGKTMELLLPPLREKSFADKKNPFFEPVEFWFATGSNNNITDKISLFDAQLNRLTDKYFNQLYFRHSKKTLDSITGYFDQKFDFRDHEILQVHKKLKLKSIETDVLRINPSKIGELLSSVNPAFHEHPAFIELFDKMFTDKLSFDAKSAQNNLIHQAVSSADTDMLVDYVKKNYLLESATARLALLKMLHDGFYSGDFPQDAILKIIASETFAGSPDKDFRETALNVLKKLEFLRAGTPAPAICLKNTDGREICTDKDNGKFKYLIFADIEMMVCREHLKYLGKIEEQFNNYLDIIIILRKTDIIEMKMFLDKQDIPGIHLVDENGNYIEIYKVRSFPVCLILNKNHEVVLPHAKAPLDGFEQQFADLLRSGRYQN